MLNKVQVIIACNFILFYYNIGIKKSNKAIIFAINLSSTLRLTYDCFYQKKTYNSMIVEVEYLAKT